MMVNSGYNLCVISVLSKRSIERREVGKMANRDRTSSQSRTKISSVSPNSSQRVAYERSGKIKNKKQAMKIVVIRQRKGW